MKAPKNIFFENILTQEECETFTNKYLEYIRNGWNGYPHDSHVGISIAEPFKSLEIDDTIVIPRLTSAIENAYGDKIKYSHSYGRLYKNGAELWQHIDRSTLDITLSVNVGGLETWPMHISNVYTDQSISFQSNDHPEGHKYREDYTTVFTPKGCGVACYAHHFVHWRDKLVCNDDEYVLQIFYHWTIIE